MRNITDIELLCGFELFVSNNKSNCIWFSVENYRGSITKERIIGYKEFGIRLYKRSLNEK